MKLIIAGSRTFNFYESKHSVRTGFIDELLTLFSIFPTEVVCGCGGTDEEKVSKLVSKGCFASDQGIDRLGEFWADSNRVPIKRMPAQWKKLGRPAGPKRNLEMGQYADALLLIWDGESKGSRHMRETMRKLKKPIYEIVIREEP